MERLLHFSSRSKKNINAKCPLSFFRLLSLSLSLSLSLALYLIFFLVSNVQASRHVKMTIDTFPGWDTDFFVESVSIDSLVMTENCGES